VQITYHIRVFPRKRHHVKACEHSPSCTLHQITHHSKLLTAHEVASINSKMGRLPFELKHKICEMAIDALGYPILPTIILVAHRFQEWSVFFLLLI
jgi:hypothetical protein